MNEDEITNLKLLICHLDLSVETKEKLYNQAHKIRNQLEQKENIIKEVREYIETHWAMTEEQQVYLYELDDRKELLEILDKANDREDK